MRTKIITQNNAVQQLTKIWNNWKVLNKSKTRRKDVGNKRDIFFGNLERLWDVGAVDAIESSKKIICFRQTKNKKSLNSIMTNKRKGNQQWREKTRYCNWYPKHE